MTGIDQMFGASQIYYYLHFFVKTLILLFIKDALNRSKVTVNTFILLQKVLNKCCSFELSRICES